MTATTKIRVARPTDQLAAVVRFYHEGLGFEILATFEDHEGFDGVMLGSSGGLYHLEFTHHHGHTVGGAPTQDNLFVFYLPETSVWEAAVAQLIAKGYTPHVSYNPYWDQRGKTFVDPDGYRVVLQNADWTL